MLIRVKYQQALRVGRHATLIRVKVVVGAFFPDSQRTQAVAVHTYKA